MAALGANTMWPFDQLRQRTYERRYKAALVVLLGTYSIERLSADQRQRVELEVVANLNRSDLPAVGWKRVLGPTALMGALRAVAMEKAEIAPLVTSLSWAQLFEPWSFWRIRKLWPLLRGFDVLPVNLVNDFRAMHVATADARALLRRHGLDIPEFDPWDQAPRQLSAQGEQSKGNINAA